jgi:hypothetical protein
VRLPKECPQCACLRPVHTNVCPHCGFEAKVRNNIFTVDGELSELNRNKQPIIDRSNVYAQIKGAVLERGWKPGAAYWKYKEFFGGEEPRGLEHVEPCPPSNQIRRWLKSRIIAFARARDKEEVRRE